MLIERRLVLKGARLGAGVLALPAWAQALGRRGITHDVASGEPGSTAPAGSLASEFSCWHAGHLMAAPPGRAGPVTVGTVR